MRGRLVNWGALAALAIAAGLWYVLVMVLPAMALTALLGAMITVCMLVALVGAVRYHEYRREAEALDRLARARAALRAYANDMSEERKAA